MGAWALWIIDTNFEHKIHNSQKCELYISEPLHILRTRIGHLTERYKTIENRFMAGSANIVAANLVQLQGFRWNLQNQNSIRNNINQLHIQLYPFTAVQLFIVKWNTKKSNSATFCDYWFKIRFFMNIFIIIIRKLVSVILHDRNWFASLHPWMRSQK